MIKMLASLLFVLLLNIITAHAQQTTQFAPAKDKEALQGYSIHLVPVSGGSFGFVIIKEKKVVWSQTNNPFTHEQEGFLHKQDAYKIAAWLVNENVKTGKIPRQIPLNLT